jgi:hypothetical protein
MDAAIPIDWSLAQQPQPLDYVPSALEGLQAGQQMGAISALHHIDINDPNSVNTGIGALVRSGAADQASALMNLNITRNLFSQMPDFMQQATAMPGQTAAAGQPQPQQAQGQPQGQDQSLDHLALARTNLEIAQDARAYGNATGQDQVALGQQLEQKWMARGMTKEAIDGALAQAATPQGAEALAAHNEAHAAALSGGEPDQNALIPPAMQPPPAGDAADSYAWAKNYLAHPQWSMYEAMLKGRGIDLGLTARAQAIMGPEFGQEATVRNAQALAGQTEAGKAPFDLVTVTLPNGSTMQVPKPMALQLGAGGALHGLTPQQEAFQKGVGGAESTVGEYKTPTGATAYGQLQFDKQGHASINPVGGATGGGGAQPTFGAPSIGSATTMKGDAEALQSAVNGPTGVQSRLGSYPEQLARGQMLIGLANTVGTGAYTQQLANAARALQPLGIPQTRAANAGLLASDLAGTFKQALGGLAVPRITSEAKAITGQIPKNTSPQDQVKVYAAGLQAATQYHQRYDLFLQNWAAHAATNDPQYPPSLARANAAWAAGPGNVSLFTMPAWQNISVGGKPAVDHFSYGGHDYLKVLPGLLPDERLIPVR